MKKCLTYWMVTTATAMLIFRQIYKQHLNTGIVQDIPVTCRCLNKSLYLQIGNITGEEKNLPNFKWKLMQKDYFPSNFVSFLLVPSL